MKKGEDCGTLWLYYVWNDYFDCCQLHKVKIVKISDLRSLFWLLLYSGQLALAAVKIGILDIIESEISNIFTSPE